jgi:putative ABC transport system substrate-binding protein
MRRREFITLIGGAAASSAWPLAARAQQPERMRLIGVMMGLREDDRQGRQQAQALREGLQELGWTNGFMAAHRTEVTSLVARHRLPAISAYRFYTELGGLLSYGNDILDNYRRAATYVDRILKGAKPSELPVQASVKFELVINLKTAKALGLTVPAFLQQRADEVIE